MDGKPTMTESLLVAGELRPSQVLGAGGAAAPQGSDARPSRTPGPPLSPPESRPW
jgi:hypothetical protein